MVEGRGPDSRLPASPLSVAAMAGEFLGEPFQFLTKGDRARAEFASLLSFAPYKIEYQQSEEGSGDCRTGPQDSNRNAHIDVIGTGHLCSLRRALTGAITRASEMSCTKKKP